MIHPAPTTTIDPSLARGVLEAVVPPTATRPGHVVISFPNTSYQMHLIPGAPVASEIGKRIIGVIRASARRVDLVTTGGKYVEPVFGHPRRVQGRVLGTDPTGRGLVIDASVPIHCALTDARQSLADFPVGEIVSFDVLDGATFWPAR